MAPSSGSNSRRSIARVVHAPRIAPGRPASEKSSAERTSIRPRRAYASEPDIEFAHTTASEIAVRFAAGSCGCRNTSIGMSRNPPPAPISVPKAPTTTPSAPYPTT